jgi:hypothetical protein
VPGWGKLVAGAVLGAAGALYATNEEFRRALPGKVRDLPVAVRQRFEAAAAAAREASALRRAEILRDLEAHGGGYTAERRFLEGTQGTSLEVPASRTTEQPAARREEV